MLVPVVEVALVGAELEVAGVLLPPPGLTTVWPVAPTATVMGLLTVPMVFDSKHPDASNATARTGRTSSEGRRRM